MSNPRATEWNGVRRMDTTVKDPADSGDSSEARAVQDYIEETPVWSDGTPVSTISMTAMQWRIWWLACAGKFFEGMIIFMSGVALPLIALQFSLDAVGHGLVAAAAILGILVGATAFGGAADIHGRKKIFIAEMGLFAAFLCLVTFAPNLPVLLFALFGVGFALGCDYPTAHLVISESIASKNRGRMVLGAFGFQAVGAITGVGLSVVILSAVQDESAWRWMYATAILPAILVMAGRFSIVESAQWLAKSGRVSEAERSVVKLLQRDPQHPRSVRLTAYAETAKPVSTFKSIRTLWRNPKTRRATIFASMPWFLQDLGTYGIGIFTPVILTELFDRHHETGTSLAVMVHHDLTAAKGAIMVDSLLIVGIVCAIVLADRVGRIVLQIVGFIGCAAGLLLATIGSDIGGSYELPMILAGFMLFNFMTNLGPNAQTYLIAGEVFPTRYRAVGAGTAASIGKIGALTTAFLFPVFLAALGKDVLLIGLVCTSLMGALVTWLFRIETKGVNLDRLE